MMFQIQKPTLIRAGFFCCFSDKDIILGVGYLRAGFTIFY